MSAKSESKSRVNAGMALLATVTLVGNGAIIYDAAYPGRLNLFGSGAAAAGAGAPEAPDLTPTHETLAEIEIVESTPAEVLSDEETPEEGLIPRAVPVPDMTVTMSEAVSGDEDSEGIAGYVLGGEGMTPEVRRAWETLEKARAKGEVETPLAPDSAFFRRAAGEIGYVPSGMEPALVRSLSEAVEPGPSSVSGLPEFITADTLMVDEILIRLQGAVAPVETDLCETASGTAYDCAAWATRGMQTIVGDRELLCHLTDELSGEGGALLGWCDITLKSGKRRDLAEIGVHSGILRVDDGDGDISPYLRTEADARAAGNGIWSGRYENEKN